MDRISSLIHIEASLQCKMYGVAVYLSDLPVRSEEWMLI